jgi:hypothetical protein
MDELAPVALAAGFRYSDAMLARIVIIFVSNFTSAFIPYDIHVSNAQFDNIPCDSISPLCKGRRFLCWNSDCSIRLQDFLISNRKCVETKFLRH